jgi:hypothetical protein
VLQCLAAGVLGYVEDTWAKIQHSVLKIQSTTRMHFARRYFRQVQSAALLLQADWRAREPRLRFTQELHQHRAAVNIQRRFKGYMAAQTYKQVSTSRAWGGGRAWSTDQTAGCF